MCRVPWLKIVSLSHFFLKNIVTSVNYFFDIIAVPQINDDNVIFQKDYIPAYYANLVRFLIRHSHTAGLVGVDGSYGIRALWTQHLRIFISEVLWSERCTLNQFEAFELKQQNPSIQMYIPNNIKIFLTQKILNEKLQFHLYVMCLFSLV